MKKLNLRQNFPTFQLLPLKNLVKGTTIYKNPEKPSCIDLILTKRPRSFHECHITETRISEFHKMTVTVMKIILKSKAQVLYTTGMLKGSIHKVFAKTSLLICMKKVLIEINFLNVFKKVFDIYTPTR